MAEAQKEFLIESIWSTGSSFDAVLPVHMMTDQWQPAANLDLDVQTNSLDDDRHEVKLIIVVDVKVSDKEVFKLKSVHTGVFKISGYSGEELEQIIQSFCPGIIYPYARSKVSAVVSDAGYPPLHLSPVDFDARYRSIKDQK